MQITMIAGNVGKDAVLRRTQSGEPVLNFSIAVNNGKDKSGNRRDSTWYGCSVWGKRAEALDGYIKKGMKLTVSGRVSAGVYEGRGTLNLSVNDLTFMGGGSEEREPVQHTEHDAPQTKDIDDTIPF